MHTELGSWWQNPQQEDLASAKTTVHTLNLFDIEDTAVMPHPAFNTLRLFQRPFMVSKPAWSIALALPLQRSIPSMNSCVSRHWKNIALTSSHLNGLPSTAAGKFRTNINFQSDVLMAWQRPFHAAYLVGMCYSIAHHLQRQEHWNLVLQALRQTPPTSKGGPRGKHKGLVGFPLLGFDTAFGTFLLEGSRP